MDNNLCFVGKEQNCVKLHHKFHVANSLVRIGVQNGVDASV